MEKSESRKSKRQKIDIEIFFPLLHVTKDNTTASHPILPIMEPIIHKVWGQAILTQFRTRNRRSNKVYTIEDLVPNPKYSEGISRQNSDLPLCENTTPLNALNDILRIVINSDDDKFR
ncbi:hypothetical protein Tco_0660588 [Tanacetum coccineum]|uniref:Uncharacterized protein n=1 Tax=Tanacetum coccineum TaxID=301880 RepID=A0ABQ5EF82_9ASTR